MAPHVLTKTERIPHKNFCGKVMLTLFWDERVIILKHYMPRGNTVTSATYADLLKNHLRPAIKSKRRGRLSTGVLLQHDNARTHTARSTVTTIQDFSFECLHIRRTRQTSLKMIFTSLDHSNRQVFQVGRRGAAGGARVAALSGKVFFFSRDIHVLPNSWNTCMERYGD